MTTIKPEKAPPTTKRTKSIKTMKPEKAPPTITKTTTTITKTTTMKSLTILNP